MFCVFFVVKNGQLTCLTPAVELSYLEQSDLCIYMFYFSSAIKVIKSLMFCLFILRTDTTYLCKYLVLEFCPVTCILPLIERS